MTAIQSLDRRSLDQATLNISNPDSFSKAFESDFALQQTGDIKSDNRFSSDTNVYPRADFSVSPLEMDTRFLGNLSLQTQSNLLDPLRSHYPLSPPSSTTVSPKQWPHGAQNAVPQDVFANNETTNPRYAQYGQLTPPEDENESLPDSTMKDQLYGSMIVPSEPGTQHIRDSSTNDGLPTPTSKRTRKNARGPKKLSFDSNDPNDMRRSKFLERNRVAASKCRQKKKEWTQNLEGRARDLQSENHSLRLWLESMRDEYMYLKTQIAEHRSCNSNDINEYLDDPKRDLLALSNPASRNLLDNMRRHSIKQESDDDEEHMQTESVSDDEDALGAMLADSMNEASPG